MSRYSIAFFSGLSGFVGRSNVLVLFSDQLKISAVFLNSMEFGFRCSFTSYSSDGSMSRLHGWMTDGWLEGWAETSDNRIQGVLVVQIFHQGIMRLGVWWQFLW